MATPTTAPLLERRALYILIIAALTGIGAGVLTYRPTHVAPTAIGCGIAAACLTIGWLHGVRWSALRGWHGAGLAVISIIVLIALRVAIKDQRDRRRPGVIQDRSGSPAAQNT